MAFKYYFFIVVDYKFLWVDFEVVVVLKVRLSKFHRAFDLVGLNFLRGDVYILKV